MPMKSTSGESLILRRRCCPARPECLIVVWLRRAVSGSADVALTPVTPGIAASARSTRSWKRRHLRPFGNELRRHRHAQREHAVRLEAGIGAQQPLEAAHDEPAAAEQHQRQRDLRDDHAAAHAAVPAAAAHGAAREQRRQRGPRRPDRRRHRREQAEQPRRRRSSPAPMRQSTAIASRRGKSSGASATSARVPQIAASAPRAPPARPSRPPSNSVARTTALPLAPSARDTANSCSRCAARASSTDARLTISTRTRNSAGGPEHEQRRPDARDEVGLQPDRIQLQAAALEVARVDRPADGVTDGGDLLGRCAAPRADQRRRTSRASDSPPRGSYRTSMYASARCGGPRLALRTNAKRGGSTPMTVYGCPFKPHVRADDRRVGAEPAPQPVRQHDHGARDSGRLRSARSRGRAPGDAEHVEQIRRRDASPRFRSGPRPRCGENVAELPQQRRPRPR